MVVAFALTLPSAASAFSISGTITNAAGGAPLQNICVQADGQEGQPTAIAKSAADGTYTMSSTFLGGGDPLAGGAYLVTFQNCSPFLGGTGDWVTKCCTLVELTNSSPDATLDAAMQQGGFITGTVTGGGNPLQNICIQTKPADFEFGPGVQANTASDGTYSLHNLKPGGIKILFSACQGGNWVTQYYSGKADFATADTVTVNAGAASTPSTVDVTMQPGATIHGTVTDAANPGTGIQNICVNVDKPALGQNNLPVTAKGAITAAGGAYTVTGLAPGSYKVEFKDCFSGQGFLTKWFDGQPDFANANTIGPLAAGDNATANQALNRGSSIAGTVTGTGGTPLQFICVEAYDASGLGQGGPTVAQASTNASGQYKLTPLIGGNYKLRFRDCAFHPSYAQEWFSDKTGFASADVVSVSPGQDLTGRDVQLAAGGHIAGRVTDGVGPVGGICIRATLDSLDPNAPVAFDRTEVDGTFDVGTLPAGQYVVEITDCDTVGPFDPQFWDDQANSGSANRVTVAAGATTQLPHDIVLFRPGDTTPPETSITAAPGGTITMTSVEIDYTANEPLATFTCSIAKQGGSSDPVTCPDGNPLGNHVTIGGLTDGTYTFSVAARDHAGNADSSPATASFTVAATPSGAGSGGTGTPTVTTSTVTPSTVTVKCVVPKLTGRTLTKARKALARAHCRLGKVTKKAAKRVNGRKPRKGTILAQKPKPGSKKPAGTKVAVVVAR